MTNGGVNTKTEHQRYTQGRDKMEGPGRGFLLLFVKREWARLGPKASAANREMGAPEPKLNTDERGRPDHGYAR